MTDIRRFDLERAFSKGSKRPCLAGLFSGKGGVGKSVLAFHLADQLARMGRRTLLIDADWEFGIQHILTNTIPVANLDDAVNRDNHPFANYLTNVGPNFDFIASPAISDLMSAFEPPALAKFLENLRQDCTGYDFVIFDTSSGNLDLIRLIAAATDISLLILTPELTSIANAFGLYKYLIRHQAGTNAGVIVNRAEFGKDSDYVYQKFAYLSQKFLGQLPHYAGYLLESREITEALERQRSAVETASQTPAADQLLKLCNFLTKERASLLGETSDRRTAALSSVNFETVSADIKE